MCSSGFSFLCKAGILFILLILIVPSFCEAQINESQARSILEEKGIHEDTLRVRLLKKGVDPDRISPARALEFQDIVTATIAEIETDMALRQARKDSLPQSQITQPKPSAQSTIRIPEKPKPDSSGISEEVPAYGQDIFRNKSISFYQRSDDIVAPDHYVLGAGDKLGVVGFGRSQFEHILDIQQDGFVKPEKLPRILLRGLTLAEARALLYQRYSQYYIMSKEEFQVTLQQSRNITVNVFGEVETPGSFTIPALNTVFNVLGAAGGPTKIGSVRKIKLIRGKTSIPVDVYAFMNKPGGDQDLFLQNNDYIHVPVADKMVEIKGSVVRPMRYELAEDENLGSLISLAGGALPNAYLTDVQITRYMQDKRVVANVNLRDLLATGGDYVLLNGDIVTIRSVDAVVKNIVSIEGAVAFPGEYEFKDGMRISDLISQGVLNQDARLDFAYILKYSPDGTFTYEQINIEQILTNPAGISNTRLSSGDKMHVLSLKTFAEKGSFSVEGAVKNPTSFSFRPDGNVRLAEAINMAGGTQPYSAELGYVFRVNLKNPNSIEYIPVDISKAMSAPESESNISIIAGDQIHVFSKEQRSEQLTVSIYGSVRNPGKYQFGKNMTLADLINLAGGYSYNADYSRIDIARPEYKPGQSLVIRQFASSLSEDDLHNVGQDNSTPLEPFDHVYVRSIPEFQQQQTVSVEGEVKYPGSYSILQDKERLSEIIRRAGGLTGRAFPEGAKFYRIDDSIGVVVIDLAEALRNPGAASNIVLLNGDKIFIPKSKDLVTIGGYVDLTDAYSTEFLTGEKAIAVAFRGEKSAKYYIDNFAGGVSDNGSKKSIKVQFADGRVEKTKHFLWSKQYPKVQRGSTILVGPKKSRPEKVKAENKTNWGNVLRDTVASATAVLTLVILADQLSK